MRATATRYAVAAASLTMVVCAFAPTAAQEKRVGASGGWVRLPPAGETRAQAFVTVDNPTMYEVYVTSATSDAAGRVELRDAGQSGAAREQPLMFVAVPAYGRVDMSPGGVHLLLLDLKRPLQDGDTVALTLSTDIDVTLKVEAKVRKE